LQCLSQFLRDFCWRIGEVADKLPIGTCEQEYEDDVDEEEQEVSEKVEILRLVRAGSHRKVHALLQERVLDPTASTVSLEIRHSYVGGQNELTPIKSQHLPSNMKGSKAFRVIMATDGSEFWTMARILSLLSINRPSHGMDFLISL
jgi:hypothetical protein